MDFVFSKHAEEQLIRRSLNRNTVESIILKPEQMLDDETNANVTIYQSIVTEDNKLFLYRVFVNTKLLPNVIVTVYRTTKIPKYYES
jgi:hypothetical protein